MTLQSYVSLWFPVMRHEITEPVRSSSVPPKSDYEVTRVVPTGSVSSCALVVFEICKIAIVVLNIANGLTAIQIVKLLLSRFHENRRGRGRAEKS